MLIEQVAREALVHPEAHIRAQARIVLECPELGTERQYETLKRELDEFEQYKQRN